MWRMNLHNADAALEFALSLSNAIHLLQARTQLAHEHLFKDMRTGLTMSN